MAVGTLYTHDLAVVISVAVMTMTIQSRMAPYLEKKVPDWYKLREGVRSRICVEAAVIPSRIMLIYLTVPIILNGFSPIESWTAEDTVSSLLICSILTGAYIIDLTVTRNDKGATLHHVMGPVLLIWMRYSYATFTPADALMCRLLISFVFFGAIFSGSTTTALSFIFYFRKIWFKPSQKSMSNKAYVYFTMLLPVLALSTICGNYYCTMYLHAWFGEALHHFGRWGYVPLAWVLLECTMQWRWLLWFYNRDVQYRAKFAEDEGEESALASTTVWWLPSWRFTALKILTYTWYATLAALIWRTGDPQKLGQHVLSMTRNELHSHVHSSIEL